MDKKILGILLVGIIGLGSLFLIINVTNNQKIITPNGNVSVSKSADGSTVTSNIQSNTGNVSSNLKTTVNSDGSITYNGYGKVGRVTAIYHDYIVCKDGSHTGTCDIEYNN